MDNATAREMLQKDISRIVDESMEIRKTVKDMAEDAKTYIKSLVEQIATNNSGSLFSKTPKVPRKRTTRIKAIPENDEMSSESLSFTSNRNSEVDNVTLEASDIRPSRAKRGASIKAADNIKKQQASNLNTKLRRPSNENNESLLSKTVRDKKSKRPKEVILSSDDEDTRPTKHSKVEKENETFDVSKKKQSLKRKLDDQDNETTLTNGSIQENSPKISEPATKKPYYSKSPQKKKNSKYESKLEIVQESNTPEQNQIRTTRSSSLITAQSSRTTKMKNIINETAEIDNPDETLASMYEDAIGKPLPIMNSTMNPNSTVTIEKMMNVTVLIEPLSSKKNLNETVTLKKTFFKEPESGKNSLLKDIVEDKNIDEIISGSPNVKKRSLKSKLSTNAQVTKNVSKLSELITDDESSPERKGYDKERPPLNQKKRVTRSNSSMVSEDEILRTPNTMRKNKEFKLPTVKSAYKTAALFSPYAKDSVKKRVEAFEQVAVSPKQVGGESSGRVTRTKTRALAAASETPGQTLTVKLARKSLAKAKKISLAKLAKDSDDTKENENLNTVVKTKKKTSSIERPSKKSQSKTTPLRTTRMLQVPNSANKNQYITPSNAQSHISYTKPLTASRGNIVTHVDSFIQPMKSASKTVDKMAEERRRRAHEEDARRKREELLKARAEEKRRKREEKELKNKLAREMKEKLEHEKRLRAEKEREEKAKLAQQMQEKQKEEMERKRIAQMQRAQEKEERRKQEEYLRMQRLQEQEEQERLLAEQKRREQEMEKRKQAELRHQMEAMKVKQQLLDKAALQAKMKPAAPSQKPVVYNYKIDSDPDEEDTDDECKPKHQVPHWALKHVRQTQLAMQQYIPMKAIQKFFDVKKCTPDLRDLFKGIDPRKLKRSSSAIWKTPPRFSMMDQSIIKD